MTTVIASVILLTFLFTYDPSKSLNYFTFILLFIVEMTTLNANVTFICNDKDLNPTEKLQAIEAEVQQTLYTDEEYDEAVYWKGISIFDVGMWVEDADERNNTSLDPLFLEDWIDVELLFKVRQLHNQERGISEDELDTYDSLDDCLSINHSWRDKRKFAVMKVSRDWNGIRKVIWNEEGNFEERENPDDNPDWLNELETKQEEISKSQKETKARKMLWKQLREDRDAYKKYYNAYDSIKDVNPTEAKSLKAKWDRYYKSYMYYSKLQDRLNEIDREETIRARQKEANNILHLFVQFQQEAPNNIIEKLLREDVKVYYKKYWYNATINYLNKCIKKARTL